MNLTEIHKKNRARQQIVRPNDLKMEMS